MCFAGFVCFKRFRSATRHIACFTEVFTRINRLFRWLLLLPFSNEWFSLGNPEKLLLRLLDLHQSCLFDYCCLICGGHVRIRASRECSCNRLIQLIWSSLIVHVEPDLNLKKWKIGSVIHTEQCIYACWCVKKEFRQTEKAPRKSNRPATGGQKEKSAEYWNSFWIPRLLFPRNTHLI